MSDFPHVTSLCARLFGRSNRQRDREPWV